jgi:hypothetical protein
MDDHDRLMAGAMMMGVAAVALLAFSVGFLLGVFF